MHQVKINNHVFYFLYVVGKGIPLVVGISGAEQFQCLSCYISNGKQGDLSVHAKLE